jgi:hypothetical protein
VRIELRSIVGLVLSEIASVESDSVMQSARICVAAKKAHSAAFDAREVVV